MQGHNEALNISYENLIDLIVLRLLYSYSSTSPMRELEGATSFGFPKPNNLKAVLYLLPNELPPMLLTLLLNAVDRLLSQSGIRIHRKLTFTLPSAIA